MFRFLVFTILLLNVLTRMTNAKINDERIITYLNDESHSVGPDGSLPSVEASRGFVDWVLLNWKSTVASLPEIAPSPRQQALLVVAGEFLAPPDYIAFIDSICTLREMEKIPPTTLRFVLWAGMQKRDFLGYNYQMPDVAKLGDRLEKQIAKDYPGEWLAFFSDLKSGELKKNIIARRAREGQPMPESLGGNNVAPEDGNGTTVPQVQQKREPNDPETSSELADRQAISSTPWAVIAVLIVAATGLLWLLVKKRK